MARSPGARCGAPSGAARDQLDQRRAVALQLLRADAGDAARAPRGRRGRCRAISASVLSCRMTNAGTACVRASARRQALSRSSSAFSAALSVAVRAAGATRAPRARPRGSARRIATRCSPFSTGRLAVGEPQRAVRLVVDARESQRDQLAEHDAPRAPRRYRRRCRTPTACRDPSACIALAGLAAQHVDQVHGAEALAGAVDRRQRLLRRGGGVEGLGRREAGVAIAAGRARLAEIVEQAHAPAAGGLAQAEQRIELGRATRACTRRWRPTCRSAAAAARRRPGRRPSTRRPARRRGRRVRSPGSSPRCSSAGRDGRRSARPACRCPCRTRSSRPSRGRPRAGSAPGGRVRVAVSMPA